MAGLDQLNLPMGGLTLSNDSGQFSGCGPFSCSLSASTPSSRSCENAPTLTTTATSSGYLQEFTEVESQSYCDHMRRLSLDTVNTNLTLELDVSYFDKFPKLAEVERVPWGESELLNILREGRTKDYSGHITVEIMQKLGYLLQRPLTRISYEAQQLSLVHKYCGREEIMSAMKIVLQQNIANTCLKGAHKAMAMFSMSGDNFKESKSRRCGGHFAIGKFHRWMIDAGVALRVREDAAIYLASCMQSLLEDVVLLSFGKELLGKSSLCLCTNIIIKSIYSIHFRCKYCQCFNFKMKFKLFNTSVRHLMYLAWQGVI